MEETKKIYGAYGSNMNLKQMGKRCPNAKAIGKGILNDYRLTFRGVNNGVANIEKMMGRTVPIVLWEITPECEKSLDIYEGFPRLYIKQEVEVETDEGTVKAMVYVMTKKYEEYPSEPSEYYFDTIMQGYIDNDIPVAPLNEALDENIKEVNESNF